MGVRVKGQPPWLADRTQVGRRTLPNTAVIPEGGRSTKAALSAPALTATRRVARTRGSQRLATPEASWDQSHPMPTARESGWMLPANLSRRFRSIECQPALSRKHWVSTKTEPAWINARIDTCDQMKTLY